MSEARMDLHAQIMNIRAEKTLSHFIKVSEYEAYLLGHKQARHDAAEIASSVSAQLKAADELASALDAITDKTWCNSVSMDEVVHVQEILTAYRKAKEQAQ